MALQITLREVDGVSVLTLDGRIALGAEANTLRDKVKALLAEGKRKIVLDMNRVTLIDSSGLGTLVGLQRSTQSQSASLRLCSLSSLAKELLQMTRLITVFEVSAKEADAVQALSQRA